jgi:hypothetical protein
MNHSEQRLSEACREYHEATVARHLHQLFRRLPMLSGFWLHPDFKVGEVVFSWTGYTAGPALYDQVTDSLAQLAEECPEALQLMRGRTFARAVH